MKTDKYSDRTDVNIRVSLYEYGLIRNPNTDKVIVCLNSGIEHNKENKPIIRTSFISFDEVKEALEEASPGYFSFIGSDLMTEPNQLRNDYLSLTISSMNQYSGTFNDYLYY